MDNGQWTMDNKKVLQRIREFLALFIVTVLPFHAFLVTVGTKLIAGSGHAPLPLLAAWKEMLLSVILLVACIEIAAEWKVERGKMKVKHFAFNMLDWLIVALSVLAIIISTFNFQLSTLNWLYGAKYDLLPLVAFVILRRVSWSQWFKDCVVKVLLWTGSIVGAYGIATFFLPNGFFTALGYSDLHSLYIPGGPLAAFQHIGGTSIQRIQSVMSGPNQLGLWLLIPLSLMLIKGCKKPLHLCTSTLVQLLLYTIALFLTFSRSAWIGAVVIIGLALWISLPKTKFRRIGFWFPTFAKATAGWLVSGFFIAMIIFAIKPDVLVRMASTRDHLRRPIAAIQMMIAHPLGLGLGSAGPASNRTGDACVYLEKGSDTSWAHDHPNLCVFVADQQVQPLTRPCHCPFLPENWYLQIGVELGVVGLILYVTLILLLLRKLSAVSCQLSASSSDHVLKAITLLSFLGISIAALFLHAWEDAAVAYTLWLLIAIVLCNERQRETFVDVR